MNAQSASPRSLSVALPVYNGENFIEATLESICAQGFGDFELFVSDNCSTDRTPEILARFAARDPRIRVSRSETFLRAQENFNRAVAMTDTEWVKLICHDDLMEPQCMQRIHDALPDVDDERVGLIGNGEAWLFENGKMVPARAGLRPLVTSASGRDAILAAFGTGDAPPLPAISSATVKRQAFFDFGGFDRRLVHCDIFAWMRLLTRWNYVFLSEVLTVTRIHAGQDTAAVRRELRSVGDFELFLPEFIAEFGDELALPRSVRLKAWLKPASIVASTIVVELLKKRYRSVVEVLARSPKRYLPFLPALVARNLRMHRASLARAGSVTTPDQAFP